MGGGAGPGLHSQQMDHGFHSVHFTPKPAQHPGPGSLGLSMVFCKLGIGGGRGRSPGTSAVAGGMAGRLTHTWRGLQVMAPPSRESPNGVEWEPVHGSEWDLSPCLPH